MATTVYDVVVVGAGLMGSAAAYYAAKAGKRVLVLEQFELLHGKGSSHGSSRIFRVGYPHDTYTELCLSSLKLWRAIEKEAGVQLIQMTGELDFASERIDELRGLEQTLAKYKIPFEVLTGGQANKRFPGFSLPADGHAVFNPVAGVLNPTLAMDAMQKLSKRMGAEIREHSPVTSVVGEQEAGGALAVVTLADGTQVRSHQCIVTAGPWTEKLLKVSGSSDTVKLQPIATFGAYWKCKSELYAPDKFPVFIKYGYPEVYGLPMMNAHEGVKICRHDGPDIINPDARAGVVQPADKQAHLQSFIADNFSNVDSSAPNLVDDCMYTMTPDANFIIDFLEIPKTAWDPASASKKVVVGAGFSGHGAKMTPVIGQILADLALKGKTNHPTEIFHFKREAAATEHYSFPVSHL